MGTGPNLRYYGSKVTIAPRCASPRIGYDMHGADCMSRTCILYTPAESCELPFAGRTSDWHRCQHGHGAVCTAGSPGCRPASRQAAARDGGCSGAAIPRPELRHRRLHIGEPGPSWKLNGPDDDKGISLVKRRLVNTPIGRRVHAPSTSRLPSVMYRCCAPCRTPAQCWQRPPGCCAPEAACCSLSTCWRRRSTGACSCSRCAAPRSGVHVQNRWWPTTLFMTRPVVVAEAFAAAAAAGSGQLPLVQADGVPATL
jgi:hypothetical protein